MGQRSRRRDAIPGERRATAPILAGHSGRQRGRHLSHGRRPGRLLGESDRRRSGGEEGAESQKVPRTTLSYAVDGRGTQIRRPAGPFSNFHLRTILKLMLPLTRKDD